MISHKHKSVFIHIPKCGGQSIEDAFIKENGLTWDSREPLILRRNDNPKVGPLWLAHLTYSEYIEYAYLSNELMDEYYKFTLVRDPYCRLESAYKYLGYNCAISFSDFIKNIVVSQSKKNAAGYYFFRPQMDFICGQDGSVKVDDVFRLEDLSKFENVIIEKAGLSVDSFLHVNKSPSREASAFWKKRIKHLLNGNFSIRFSSEITWGNEETEIVEKIYEKDFDGLGYSRKGDIL